VTIYRNDNKQEITFEKITQWSLQGEYLMLISNLKDETIYFKQDLIAAFYVKQNVKDPLSDSS
jgi:hypothetical protein